MKLPILLCLAPVAGLVCGYIGGVASVKRVDRTAWLANSTHASLTLLDAGAVLVVYDSAHTGMYQIGKGRDQQVGGWLDTFKTIFPRDTVVPMRVQRGNQ